MVIPRRTTLAIATAIHGLLLLAATTPSHAVLLAVEQRHFEGGQFFPADGSLGSPGNAPGLFWCVASGPDDCDIFDTGHPIFGEEWSEAILAITGDGTYVEMPLDPAAEALLTNGSADIVATHVSQCSNAVAPGPGLCSAAGGGFGTGTTELLFFGNDGDDPGLAPSGVDFQGFDLTSAELVITNYVFQRVNFGSGVQVAWSYDAEFRIHGEPEPQPPAVPMLSTPGLIVLALGLGLLGLARSAKAAVRLAIGLRG